MKILLEYQGVKVSKYQGVSVSRYQRINVSEHQLTTVSLLCYNLLLFVTFAYQSISVSGKESTWLGRGELPQR